MRVKIRANEEWGAKRAEKFMENKRNWWKRVSEVRNGEGDSKVIATEIDGGQSLIQEDEDEDRSREHFEQQNGDVMGWI